MQRVKFPGPNHLKACALSGQDLHAQRYINIKKSRGNYFTDVDGNIVLDMNCSQALGYNHDSIANMKMGSTAFDRFQQGKVDCSNVPPSDYTDMLRETVMPVAPQGMTQVHLCDGSATDANDAAISTALMHYAMRNKADYKNLTVMGLSGASHGDSIATMSCSDAHFRSANAPTYEWPQAPLPEVKYPFTHHTAENQAEEERCLNAAAKIII